MPLAVVTLGRLSAGLGFRGWGLGLGWGGGHGELMLQEAERWWMSRRREICDVDNCGSMSMDVVGISCRPRITSMV